MPEKEKVSARSNQKSTIKDRARRTQEDSGDSEEANESVQYCHYFNNFGRCSFAERSGRQCKYAHVKAPVCNFDGQCGRAKCMFRHTLQPRGFLGQTQLSSRPRLQSVWNQNPFPNPWNQNQYPNPWVQNPVPNPWGSMEKRLHH